MNQIGKDCMVTLSYKLHDPDGILLDNGDKPIEYMHGGYEGIFLPIEAQLNGKSVGDSVTVKLQPDEAFGEYDIELMHIEALENLPQPLEVGMMIEGETAEESGGNSVFYTVSEIADGKAVLDGNHPLAGTALVFSCTVESIRAATAEEIEAAKSHSPSIH
jgi:FKBP-type peptidyl-prolyl cis-trans isomerase SlyD